MSELVATNRASAEEVIRDALPGGSGAAAMSPGASRRSWSFYFSIVSMLVCAAFIQCAQWMGFHIRKDPVPLKKPLSAMDKRRLEPVYTLHVEPPPPMSPETIESLGTNEFLIWRLVDTTVDKSDPTSVAHLFVTYYTGQPDQVPHVPDECYLAGGYDMVRNENVRIEVPGIGAPDDRVPVRHMTFDAPRLLGAGENSRNEVLYFFHTNGEYATTRNEVRIYQSNPFDRFAYYAKIEVKFTDYTFHRLAGADESRAAMTKLLRVFMPVLLEDHFADWKALNGSTKGSDASEES